jgi:hypothetical protein
MIGLLGRIYPEKAGASGMSALRQIIKEARARSNTHGLDNPAVPMTITLLSFAFGHGCIADPLFPWIAETLLHSELDARARIERVRRKALRFISAEFEGG